MGEESKRLKKRRRTGRQSCKIKSKEKGGKDERR